MIPSLIVAGIYHELPALLAFLYTIFWSAGVGIPMMYLGQDFEEDLRIRDGFLVVTLVWLIAAIMGAVPFWMSGAIPDFIDAFFESCSGFTTTGCSILTDIESLPKSILFWRSFTHWIGGMGILIFAIALMPSLGISGQNVIVSDLLWTNLHQRFQTQQKCCILYISYLQLLKLYYYVLAECPSLTL